MLLRRFLFLTSAAAFLVFGLGAFEARADFVPIPTSLKNLLPSAAYTTVVGAETLTFSNFTYGTIPPGAVPAHLVEVTPFALSNETGIQFQTSSWSAAPGALLDVKISYVVTAPQGELINDAILIISGSLNGGTGTISAGETLTNAVTFANILTVPPDFGAILPGSGSDSVTFAGVNSILITKDILITGGSEGADLSIVTQAFSSSAVPEPTSMALLSIGMAGFFTYRRLFKRAATV
jgi:hypothetical protein